VYNECMGAFDETLRRYEREIAASLKLPESVVRKSGEPSLIPLMPSPPSGYLSFAELRSRTAALFAYAWAHPLEAAREAERERQEYEAAAVITSVSDVPLQDAKAIALTLSDELQLTLPEVRRRLMRGDDDLWQAVDGRVAR
jgi:hypothetical protein